jgi:signal peptidase I
MILWSLLILLQVIYCIVLPVIISQGSQPHLRWLGAIPLIQFFPVLRILKRPWYWWFVILSPGINLIMLCILNVEIGIAFGKRTSREQWLFGALPWLALPGLALRIRRQSSVTKEITKHGLSDKKVETALPAVSKSLAILPFNKPTDLTVTFVGPRDWTGKKKTQAREWSESILFAIIAASVIRTFFLEAFTIPTPSMEKSMLVGDYLFVSKMSFGAKTPQTPLSVPFIHNALPGSMTNSYVEALSLPYFRIPGWGEVERFDPVVFNFPHGDTIMIDPFYAGHDYYGYLRREAANIAGGYAKYAQNPDKYLQLARHNFSVKKVCMICGLEKGRQSVPIGGVKHRPMDKEENYVKRCIGLPGEIIQIIQKQVHINGSPIQEPEGVMQSYRIGVNSVTALNKIYSDYHVNISDRRRDTDGRGNIVTTSSFSSSDIEKIKQNPSVVFVEEIIDTLSPEPFSIFPNSPMFPFDQWTRDNLGPMHIPAAGETIELTPENLELYRRVISNYEHNQLTQKDGKVFINGEETTVYTFKQNYYWMMGDNRHQSADSRYWGFVPEDHIVGKPVFTWFSKEDKNYQEGGKIRWNRMFRLADPD